MSKPLFTYRITISRDYLLDAKDDEEAVDKAFDNFREDLKTMHVNCNEFEYVCTEVDDFFVENNLSNVEDDNGDSDWRKESDYA